LSLFVLFVFLLLFSHVVYQLWHKNTIWSEISLVCLCWQ